ncbi:hypothetical protein Pan216_12490 [Planctomycetes bacterium Pan216]|uniref:Uncharacterized protein n=1 Tax=Kolteria novifilia TaxID=2527975 RepID=A0A518B0B6_9BACT|nr:hypothetical protein Pan216_12490 [Planctomycetes bacterium Pan216]
MSAGFLLSFDNQSRTANSINFDIILTAQNGYKGTVLFTFLAKPQGLSVQPTQVFPDDSDDTDEYVPQDEDATQTTSISYGLPSSTTGWDLAVVGIDSVDSSITSTNQTPIANL